MKRSRSWLWLLLLIPIGLGLSRLRFDVEILNLLPQTSPVVRGLKLYQENFSNARELIVTVQSPSAETSQTAARLLAETWRVKTNLVRSVVWQPPWVESPAASSEFVAYLWLNQPPAAFSNMLQRLSAPALDHTLADARERLATSFSPQELAMLGYDPLQLTDLPDDASQSSLGTGESLFVSSNGTFRVMFVEAAPDLSSYKACLAWLQSIRAVETALRESGRLPPGLSVRYTGRPAFVSEIAGGMERDMNASIAGTMVIICILFYLFHRRWKPLLWLVTLLVLVLGGTMALGALVFGAVSVISLGFAAILLGLTADYGLVLYQEARAQPRASVSEMRRLIAPSILWSAVTTATAFALLNLSSLPGLSQLGTLVALGVLLGSVVMIMAFLPPLLNGKSNGDDAAEPTSEQAPGNIGSRFSPAWVATVILVGGAIVVWFIVPPRFDDTANALRPLNSPAYATVEAIKTELGRPEEPLWVLMSGPDASAVLEKLGDVDRVLNEVREEGLVRQFTLPSRLWPHGERQSTNLALFASLKPEPGRLASAFQEAGFTESSLALTESLLATWQQAANANGVYWPANDASRWILGQATARSADRWIALGFLYPSEETRANESRMESLRAALAKAGGNLAGWDLLGPSLFRTVQKELGRVLLPMTVMLVLCLGLAFRGATGIALSLATILVSACGLFLAMQAAGWTWNLMNLMALPLLLGAGVDYSIHIQLAMERHGGNAARVRRSTGRALLLCAATTATGFGSLGLSSNAGLASLGQVCAAGLISCYVAAVYLLPAWWRWTRGLGKAVRAS